MPKRQRLSDNEITQVMRLLSDVRACQTNAALAGRLLVDGLCKLIDADVGWIAEMGRSEAQPWVPVNFTAGSQVDASLFRYMQSWGTQYPVEFDLMATAMGNEPAANMVTTWAHARSQALPGRLEPFADLVKTLNVGDMANPGFKLGNDYVFGVNLQRRGLRSKPFQGRELLILDKVARELRWMHETHRLKLAIVTRPGGADPAVANLPPRLRQTLDRLLAGSDPKAIAREFGLSVWTVREHIQRLYRHLCVNSRDELMARFIKDTGKP